MEASNTVYRLRPEGLHWVLADGEVIVLDTGSSTYLAANKAGSLLWPALVEGATRSQLIDALVVEFGVRESQAAEDADAYLNALLGLGLLAEDEL